MYKACMCSMIDSQALPNISLMQKKYNEYYPMITINKKYTGKKINKKKY